MNEQFSPHLETSMSTLEWDGIHSCKFKGGRLHSNHPSDELDSLLISSKSREMHTNGKRQFHSQPKTLASADFKPCLKVFEEKYQPSKMFSQQHITKLIKIPFRDESEPSITTLKMEGNRRDKYQTLGKSKIKALQNGLKQTGIYRHFFNSQAKSANVINKHQ